MSKEFIDNLFESLDTDLIIPPKNKPKKKIKRKVTAFIEYEVDVTDECNEDDDDYSINQWAIIEVQSYIDTFCDSEIFNYKVEKIEEKDNE